MVVSAGTEGGTPIHFAARKKLTRTLEMLLNYGGTFSFSSFLHFGASFEVSPHLNAFICLVAELEVILYTLRGDMI